MYAYAQTHILACVHTHHSCMHLQTHFGESHLYTHIYPLKKLPCCRIHNHCYAHTRAATCMRTSTHAAPLKAGPTHQSTQDRRNYTHRNFNKLNDSICWIWTIQFSGPWKYWNWFIYILLIFAWWFTYNWIQICVYSYANIYTNVSLLFIYISIFVFLYVCTLTYIHK